MLCVQACLCEPEPPHSAAPDPPGRGHPDVPHTHHSPHRSLAGTSASWHLGTSGEVTGEAHGPTSQPCLYPEKLPDWWRSEESLLCERQETIRKGAKTYLKPKPDMKPERNKMELEGRGLEKQKELRNEHLLVKTRHFKSQRNLPQITIKGKEIRN